MFPRLVLFFTSLWISLLTGQRSLAQDDVADIASQDLRIGKDEHKRYFLIQPPKNAKAPMRGYGLVAVLHDLTGGISLTGT
ncbi:MAG TPA: hypothetical protein VG097_15990 [Gemmata sp.]|jgi:hypothetical protein|nr:hypothetical protein [Gemmata sp.]